MIFLSNVCIRVPLFIWSKFGILVPKWNYRYEGIPVYVPPYSSTWPNIIRINMVVYLSVIEAILAKVWFPGSFSDFNIHAVVHDV